MYPFVERGESECEAVDGDVVIDTNTRHTQILFFFPFDKEKKKMRPTSSLGQGSFGLVITPPVMSRQSCHLNMSPSTRDDLKKNPQKYIGKILKQAEKKNPKTNKTFSQQIQAIRSRIDPNQQATLRFLGKCTVGRQTLEKVFPHDSVRSEFSGDQFQQLVYRRVGGDLYSFLKKPEFRTRPFEEIIRPFLPIVNLLTRMKHTDDGYAHLDIKTRNILVDHDAEVYSFYLHDFDFFSSPTTFCSLNDPSRRTHIILHDLPPEYYPVSLRHKTKVFHTAILERILVLLCLGYEPSQIVTIMKKECGDDAIQKKANYFTRKEFQPITHPPDASDLSTMDVFSLGMVFHNVLTTYMKHFLAHVSIAKQHIRHQLQPLVMWMATNGLWNRDLEPTFVDAYTRGRVFSVFPTDMSKRTISIIKRFRRLIISMIRLDPENRMPIEKVMTTFESILSGQQEKSQHTASSQKKSSVFSRLTDFFSKKKK